MSSIFRRDDEFFEKPNRNTVDFSFQNNLTAKFGALYPCLCTPVIPGDSLSIKPTFGLKFMPMTFPVQTRMKASIHYFYVRNRNLWKDWPDFIGKTKEGLVPPYIHLTEQNRKQVETCQLGDFLGIPTVTYDKVYNGVEQDFSSGIISFGTTGVVIDNSQEGFTSTTITAFNNIKVGDLNTDYFNTSSSSNTATPSKDIIVYGTQINSVEMAEYIDNDVKIRFNKLPNTSYKFKPVIFNANGIVVYVGQEIVVPTTSDVSPYEVSLGKLPILSEWFENSGSRRPNILLAMIANQIYQNQAYPYPTLLAGRLIAQGLDTSELGLSELPWRSDANPNGIPISALPFRAYESIYNTFYRNAENNPLIINGVPEYNKWLRTTDGGADTNFYPLMYHNWEDDFLTTAVPSPQQGNAPLVGLSGTPTLTIAHDDGSTTTMNLDVDDEGNVTAAIPQSGDAATHAALVDAVNYGISINDFRNVNSFQRWLENNIRRGYKYRDQIKTHYGVTVRYDELDMPEFIGGTSEHVMVNQISQTTPVDGKGLGDMAGQASAVGQGQTITHYCDEHGFIIGILCIKPVANYSQLLPKFFNVTDTFDYYFPEFGHIGMQPITYAEVTPLQANLEGKLNDVFGYQRAWYDLIAKTDEVHGLFRSNFRNFLINRTFDGTPELGADFTVIDPEQINDVFQYQGNTDKILGQIYMEISKKTPIPLYGIPKLE